ncbi:ribonuclease E activity regulator RraA [Kineococcus arenarius]|uniref:ribonuclease E activity regulator RraA n=1 Tax=unclassified Kineococcus TaxID=2621656 RepID=UPI003D7ED840
MTDPRPTADVCDQYEAAVTTAAAQFRRFGGRARFAGRVQTVSCFEDNVLVRSTLSEPGDERVLVVDGGGSLRVALMGDDMARLAARQGWAGVVVHGAVRDVDELRGIDLGLVALGSNPRRSAKRGEGSVGTSVEFGGAVFTPGDLVHVDADGVAVVPAGAL